MSSNERIREPMLDMYLFEATQLIEQLEEISIKCEKDKEISTEAINEIFRIMHTIKSSSAMMMFNNISVLAHSLEDIFFFIRENENVSINFDSLFDLVLNGIDFIKVEINKIENDEEADGTSEELVQKNSTYLELMKKDNSKHCDFNIEDNMKKDEKNPIEVYKYADEDGKQKYQLKIIYEDGCEMESVRAFMFVQSLKELTENIFHIPKNIDDDSSSPAIKKDGFLVCFSAEATKETIVSLINTTSFLKDFELNEIQDYSEEIKSLYKLKENVLIDDSKKDDLDKKEKIDEVKSEKPIKEEKKNNDYSTKTNKGQGMISVNVSKLDMLLDLVGEIVISEAMVTKNPDLNGLELDNFNKAARQLRKLTNELQDVVMSIRMVPVAMTFQKMNRIVRDMCKKLNKDIELEIIGEETEVDKNIIDHISDPLMHLVRNSLDHGIESKEDRIKAGKSDVGKVTLEAKNAGSDVLILIKDDGKGLDKKKIYEKAKKQGLVYKAENELTDKEIFSYILLPGFSTNEVVTEFSGRGVGMDVVRKNIDTIGGSISIDSVEGKGTTFSIKIPLTLAIIDGLQVSVGKGKYTLPITSIKESFKAKDDEVIADSNGNEMIMIRGECYPIFRLHRIFNIKTEATKISEGIIIMVEGDGKLACLFADNLIGEQQVVVKALPNYIKKAQGIAGCTILGDGSISLILDVNGVFNR